MSQTMAARELAPDIVRIPVDVPFPVPPANVTFFDGAEPTLFDTGPYTEDGWRTLQSRAKQAGVDLGRVERIVLTHSHLDHAGNAGRLHEATGAEIWVHEAEAPIVRDWGRSNEERNRSYDRGLRRAGLPLPLLEKLARSSRDVDRMMTPAPVHRALRGGERFVAGDRTVTVLHTPGHTAGSCIYWDDEARIAVTGDTVLERITPNALSVRKEETGALGRYLDTLRRLRETPLGMMVPGHGKPFGDVVAIVDRALGLYARRRQRILDHMAAAGHPVTVWDLVEREWPEGQKGAAFLMTSEIQGHMDLLVAEGRASCTEAEQRDDGDEAARYAVAHEG